MTDLTPRQRQVLEFIDAEVRHRGLPAQRPRDRRGRRPVVELHGARPPRRAPGQGLPPPRPHQAPRHRGLLRAGLRCQSSSAGRSATSRSSATSPPAPACSRPRTSRRRCPLPEDFTGDGQLFMLRVRGDSMIEAGILDGDYVVVRQQPDRRARRHRRRRHPRRGGHGQDLPAPSRQDRAAPGERRASTRWCSTRRGHDLRQGRLAPPSLLNSSRFRSGHAFRDQ